MTKKGANQNKTSDCGGDVECSLGCSVERSEGDWKIRIVSHVAELSDPRHGHQFDGSNRDDVNVNWQVR